MRVDMTQDIEMFCRQFAMRNQNYGGGGSEPGLLSPALTPAPGVAPVTPVSPRLSLAPASETSPGPGETVSSTPPASSLLSLHPANPALRAFGEGALTDL